jgi:cell division septation protein DedD
MTEIKPLETQQELFREFSKEPKKVDRFPSIAKPQKPVLISTNVEQLILAGIVLILAACFVFFLGMLRGRSLDDGNVRSAASARTAQPRTASSAQAVDPVRLQSVKKALLKERALSTPVQQQTAASAAKPQTAAKAAAKPYTIELAVFKKRETAEKEVAALRRNGFFATMAMTGDYYEVCVGQYASIEEAKKDLKLFAARYKGRFLRRR